MTPDFTHDFRAVSRPCRIHSGEGALDALGAELARNGATRALVICNRSVAEDTDLPDRIRAAADGRVAGIYGGMGKDAPLSAVLEAVEAARSHAADALIAVGGGSVIQGTRVTAILLAETGSPDSLATQYPEDGPAISPRLKAEKLPILNVPTIGTTAQDRGGSPIKAVDRRLEYFDPKTRPVALFWDRAALETAPRTMVRDTTALNYWRGAMDMAARRVSVLTDMSRRQVLTLTARMTSDLAEGRDGAALRGDLCIATWLQNRAADDGARPVDTWASRVTYAFAVALFHRHGEVSQGAATAALAPGVLRAMGPRDPDGMQAIAEALGLETGGDAAAARIADHFAERFAAMGLATDLTALDIPRDSATPILESALRNFNADPRREFLRDRDALAACLDGCW